MKPPPPPREVIYRHTFLVRVSHWINALVIFLMIGTGLNIFNAHPRLYWGQKGDQYDQAFIAIHAASVRGRPHGVTEIGRWRFDTTGILGWSQDHGHAAARAWPAWITLPSFTDLADARHWHFFLAWILVLNGAAYLAWSLATRHIQRDLWPNLSDLRSLPRSILDHARNRHPTGDEARRYNVLQRLAYLSLIGMVLGMVLTGLTMSPGVDAAIPGLLDLFGGRQSARTLHFLFACGIAAFVFIHLAEVVLAGPINEIGSIVTGYYRLPAARARAPRLRGR